LKAWIANTCLLVWAILLAVIGMQAVSGKASTIILDIAQTLTFRKEQDTANRQLPPASQGAPVIAPSSVSINCPTPGQGVNQSLDGSTVLEQYIQTKYRGQSETSVPPIAVVLDRLQVSVNWRDAKEIDSANGPNVGAPTWNDYCNLFDIAAKRLEAIADFSPEVSVGNTLKISNNIMPSRFRSTDVEIRSADGKQLQKFQKFQEQDIDLPVEAALWVKARQAAIAARKSQISFLDLFILLIILGGFGSWIYLVRRHINPNIPVDLSEYFYRPPLGMALAIAVFIVNLTVHSFVSTSNITEVRRETLILLAFAAGLLSDKTYDFIEKVTGEKIGSTTGKQEVIPVQASSHMVSPAEKHNTPHDPH
jgi:hypothetical protein